VTSPVDGGTGLRRVLLLMGLFLMLVQIHRAGGSVVANEMIAAGLSPSDAAAVISAMFLAAALFQLPTGLMFDRFGASRTLSVLGAVAVLGIVIFALSSTVPGLAGGRLLIGLGHGGVIAGIYMLALTWVPASRVATVTGRVIAIAGGIGGMLATTPLLLALTHVGHRTTFLGVAALTGAVTLAVARFVRDAPGEAPVQDASRRESFAESLRGLWQVAVDRKLWPIYAMGSCFAMPFNAVGALWAGPYLVDVHDLSAQQASVAVLCMVMAFNLGNFVYGPVERLLRTRKWTVFAGVLMMVASLSVLAGWPGLAVYGAAGMMTLLCLCAPFYPVLAAHCRGFVPLGRAGRAIACVNLVGLSVVFLVQLATGWLVEHTAGPDGAPTEFGYRLAFAAIGVVLALGAVGYMRARDMPP
jgi:predicted MFS family arabinose efflux permease